MRKNFVKKGCQNILKQKNYLNNLITIFQKKFINYKQT